MTKRKLLSILLIIFITIFSFSSYKIINNMIENRKAIKAYNYLKDNKQYVNDSTYPDTEKPLVSLNFTNLKAINNEIIGWISNDNLKIDYPILHTSNNDYYLDHLYNKNESIYGSIFMDYRNNNIDTDKNVIIYGHLTLNGTMFDELQSYKKQDYYKTYPYLYLYTPNGDYIIEIISTTVESGDKEFVKLDINEDNITGYIDQLKKESLITSSVTINKEDRIISLCTCTNDNNNGRLMIVGKITQLTK